MDPMIDFVRGRTSDLQRTADDVRRERDLRAAATTSISATSKTARAPRRLEPVATTEVACDPCQPSAAARPAA